jgi:O-antigen ligase
LVSSLLRDERHPVEVFALLAFAFVLPIVEAPKQIFAALYAIAWLAYRVRDRDWGGRWDGWDTLFALWFASGIAVAAFAGIRYHEWNGASDLLRYVLLGWLVKRGGYGARTWIAVLVALVAGTACALLLAYWVYFLKHLAITLNDPNLRLLDLLFRTRTGITLELKSVGHVNHSSIYLAIVTGAATGLAMAYWSRLSGAMRVAAVLVLLSFGGSLLVMASRGAMLAAGVVAAVLSLAWWPRSRVPAVAMGLALALLVGAATVLNLEIVKKQKQYDEQGITLSYRDTIWNAALAAGERYPLFGVGMDNYNRITLERIEGWRREAGKPFDSAQFTATVHGHSLYFNAIAERGWVGFGVLAAVLIAWAVSLARGYPGRDGTPIVWAIWAASASAWTVTVVAGVFNTTLHHEHGMLAAMLLGIWLAVRRLGAATAR